MAKQMIKSMLTTVDNPYDPFIDFDDWYRFDQEHNYFSCEKLAEILPDLNDSNEVESVRITEAAIDYIVKNDPLNIYTKVQKVLDVDTDDD